MAIQTMVLDPNAASYTDDQIVGKINSATVTMASQTETVAHKATVAANTTTPATTGTQAVDMYGKSVLTITPTGACTFNASGGFAGQRVNFIITTSGTSAFALTFGTNFKAAGTLSTGTVTAKVFQVSFCCKDGTLWVEQSRTVAM